MRMSNQPNPITVHDVFYGATQNGNAKVGGWLPFVVSLSPLYREMRVSGTLYTDYRSGVYDCREDAMESARRTAIEWHCEPDVEPVSIDGCHRCWNDNDPRHLAWDDAGKMTCATCGRAIESPLAAFLPGVLKEGV